MSFYSSAYLGYSMRVSVRKNQLKGQLFHGVGEPIKIVSHLYNRMKSIYLYNLIPFNLEFQLTIDQFFN